MLKCLCIGSSLDLPREGVLYSDTWIAKCREKFPGIDFINRSQWAQTSRILNDPQALEFVRPDVIILHLGIVDCAPRRIFENYILRANALLLKMIFKYSIWKISKGKYPSWAVVPEKKFEMNFENYLKRCKKSGIRKVVLISIGNPGPSMIRRNPRIAENVDHYNSVLYRLSEKYDFVENVMPLKNPEMTDYLPDGYHISPCGHDKILNSLQLIIDKVKH